MNVFAQFNNSESIKNKNERRKQMRKQFRAEEVKKQAKRELIEAQLTYGFFLATFAATILMILI